MPVKKKNLLLLALLLLLLPSAAGAQELPQLFAAVKDGLSEGIAQGAAIAHDGMTEELTLELSADSARIEAGRALRLTVNAGNPRPQETKVAFDLKLPGRLKTAQDTTWEATLPPAQMDEESGMLMPSKTAFVREIALSPGGGSEQAEIEIEMSMGTRFYRARLPLALCVADISASAVLTGTADGKLQPGDTFAYDVEIANRGTAPKDVQVGLALPESTRLGMPVPAGFRLENGVLRGQVHVKADTQETNASSVTVHIPLAVMPDALEKDEDALRLLTGALQVDGERVALPRIQVCGAKISAQLVADSDSLKAGEKTNLRMVIVNSGLAPADVQLSCMLPKGLKLAEEQEEGEKSEEEPDDCAGAVLPPADDGGTAAGEAVPSGEAQTVMAEEKRALCFDVQMDAAKETDGGIAAATKVIEIDVVSDTMQENLREQLVGAALAWTVDGGETQLSEAVVMRVYQPTFLGIPWKDWNGLFWAGLLLMVTISLLYAAVRSDHQDEDFCCE